MRDGFGKSEKMVNGHLDLYQGYWFKDKKVGKGTLHLDEGKYDGELSQRK